MTPGLAGSGAQQEAVNEEFGTELAAVCDYVALVGARPTAPIKVGLTKAGFDPSKLYVAKGLKDALARVHGLPMAKEKVILLENDPPDDGG